VSEAVPPENLKLRRKLFLARKAAEKVEKQGHNRDGDFTYARAEDVLEEASRQLEKRDILILGSLIEEELILGKSGVLAKVVIEYTVTDSTTGEELPPIRWVGTGVDTPGDKALFKATTGCEKYFLAKLLGIRSGPTLRRRSAQRTRRAPRPSTDAISRTGSPSSRMSRPHSGQFPSPSFQRSIGRQSRRRS